MSRSCAGWESPFGSTSFGFVAMRITATTVMKTRVPN